jgi:hypothetical protein
MRTLIAFGCIAFCCNSSAEVGVDDWIRIEDSKLSEDHWRPSAPDNFGAVVLDLNNDGLMDEAFLVVNRGATRSAVKVCFGGNGQSSAGRCRVIAAGTNISSVMGLDKRPRGCYEYSEADVGSGTSGRVCSKGDVLEYFRFGSSSSFFVAEGGVLVRYWESH